LSDGSVAAGGLPKQSAVGQNFSQNGCVANGFLVRCGCPSVGFLGCDSLESSISFPGYAFARRFSCPACRVEISVFQKNDKFLIFYQMARAGLLITSPGEPAGRATWRGNRGGFRCPEQGRNVKVM
jgi:hypothetical protein